MPFMRHWRMASTNAHPLRWAGNHVRKPSKMARLEGFEPPTNGFGSHYSIRLSYRRTVHAGQARWAHSLPGLAGAASRGALPFADGIRT